MQREELSAMETAKGGMMATIDIMKCDGCGREIRGGEVIGAHLSMMNWLQIKVTGMLRKGNTEISCSDALFHFCPECNTPLYDMLVACEVRDG